MFFAKITRVVFSGLQSRPTTRLSLQIGLSAWKKWYLFFRHGVL